uniref:Uncharacterized protein n=1 Tax=Arundo donax TaxID=35708 RepID=A0A0A9HIN2_ARUDO
MLRIRTLSCPVGSHLMMLKAMNSTSEDLCLCRTKCSTTIGLLKHVCLHCPLKLVEVHCSANFHWETEYNIYASVCPLHFKNGQDKWTIIRTTKPFPAATLNTL